MAIARVVAIAMFSMARSRHRSQALLRDQMSPRIPFLNLDAAHASAKVIPKRAFQAKRWYK